MQTADRPLRFDGRPYDVAPIRQLLMAVFTPEELRRFCLDRPLFQRIVPRFDPGCGLEEMVDEVIDYCQTQRLCGMLLAEVQATHAGQYARIFGEETPAARPQQRRQGLALDGVRVLGCSLRNVDSLRPGLTCHVGGHEVEIWAESYTPRGGETVHRYTDGPMAGDAAVIRHGNAVTLGAWSPTLIREVLAGLLRARDIPQQVLPEGVRVARRGDLATWLNFNQAPAELPDGTMLEPVSFSQRPV